MKLKLRYDNAHGYLNTQRDQVLELDGVVLDGTVDTREVLPQLDSAVILEWLTEQGYVITHREQAA
ncbi:hypothetical protein WP3W18E01_24220 [Raoultella ornithinolytica]|uniref:Thioredoxin reductase n=1 Tax=Raoultella ornithinolytica TaxID=54291 RepID=A0A9Q9N0P2_RAOOR|nr:MULTISPECIES: hypothetical protein [Klebsiella/Raoultella group]EJR0221555.1 hypothetical protein [Raoultella planticola]EJR0351659.1 hypothetical protein [Raoultella planticola]EKT9523049.1 hypothetical protein [Raoultella ornithinolytica]EKV6725729.1 hypothetical protein [Raoultella ornithinolytica]EKW7116215.1 hypothetical protein [Raoultella ornithinolytica]